MTNPNITPNTVLAILEEAILEVEQQLHSLRQLMSYYGLATFAYFGNIGSRAPTFFHRMNLGVANQYVLRLHSCSNSVGWVAPSFRDGGRVGSGPSSVCSLPPHLPQVL